MIYYGYKQSFKQLFIEPRALFIFLAVRGWGLNLPPQYKCTDQYMKVNLSFRLCDVAVHLRIFFHCIFNSKQEQATSKVESHCSCGGACNCPVPSVFDDTDTDSGSEDEEDFVEWEVWHFGIIYVIWKRKRGECKSFRFLRTWMFIENTLS